MDKILQATDAKMLKLTEQTTQNQTREKRSTTENTTAEMKLISVPLAMKSEASDGPIGNVDVITAARNVVLLLIDERGPERKKENPWEDCKKKLPFAIEGFLQVFFELCN